MLCLWPINTTVETEFAFFQLQTLSKFPITVFCSAPTAYRMLVQNDMSSYKFNSLKHCVSAGEPINPEVMEQWRKKTGLDIYEGYGQTETVLICGNFKGMKIKPGSMGKPSPAFDVKDNPSKTASTLRGSFYITGDRGYMDEDGYFWFVARSDDIILSSGYRIGPFEVESALIEHPSIAESAVVSSPDPIRGEVVKAFIVLNPDYKSHDQEQLKKEIQEHVKKTTAPYKYPRKVGVPGTSDVSPVLWTVFSSDILCERFQTELMTIVNQKLRG